MDEVQKILIVDDDERNIRLIRAMLHRESYKFESATSGKEALDKVSIEPPDLILLDIMMPGIDGFKTCRILKGDEKSESVPIIMVTALQDRSNRIMAMEAGADDFVNKPIDQTELAIRIKSLLRIKAYHDGLLKSYDEIAEKNKKLEELEGLKEYLTHMIVHDLRNPLTVINMTMELLSNEENTLSESNIQLLDTCRCSCTDLEQMIQNILDIRKLEEKEQTVHREEIELRGIVNETVEQFQLKLDTAGISLAMRNWNGIPPVQADRKLIRRVIANLLNNAICHTPDGGNIEISIEQKTGEDCLCFMVRDDGEGIPTEYQERIFDKFEQMKTKDDNRKYGGYGLGLSFCRMVVEAHKGKIWVESDGIGNGSSFKFTIPLETD